MPITVLIAIIIGVVLLLVFGIPGTLFAGETLRGVGTQADLAFGDCDRDRVANDFDQCPTISTEGRGDRQLTGCPSDITRELAVHDQETYNRFYVLEGEELSETECDPEEKLESGTCVNKCDFVHGSVTEVIAEEEPGLLTQGDLSIEDFIVYGVLNPTLLEPDLDEEKFLPVSISFSVKNVGEAQINSPYIIKVRVCENEGSDRCVDKMLFEEIQRDTRQTADNSLQQLDVLPSGGEPVHKFFYIRLGARGDYCDGGSTTSCTIRLVVDAPDNDNANLLSEPDETNNIKTVDVILNNKAPNDELFESRNEVYSAVHFKDNLANGPFGTIDEAWRYYSSIDSNCDDSDEGKPSDSGCRVIVEEADRISDDCVTAVALPGEPIPLSRHERVEVSLNNILGDESDPEEMLGWQWKSTPEYGSLLCKGEEQTYTGFAGTESEARFWYACNQNTDGLMLQVGQEWWICENNEWDKR